jgi:hypothetical protein
VRFRKIDPKLHHLERAALLRKFALVFFFVNYAGGCRHPLDIAGTDDA